MAEADHGGEHGGSPAAWTAVSIIFLGFLVGGLAIPLKSLAGVIVGGALIVAGAIVGKVMQVMGYGLVAKPVTEPVTESARTAAPTAAPTPEPESSSVSAS